MKLSKKSRYGLRALIDLAVNSRTELVSLGSIAQRNDISAQYVGRGDQEAIQHLIIDRINDCVQEILEDVTLKDLVDAYEGYQDSVEGMYYI